MFYATNLCSNDFDKVTGEPIKSSQHFCEVRSLKYEVMSSHLTGYDCDLGLAKMYYTGTFLDHPNLTNKIKFEVRKRSKNHNYL